MIKQTAQRRFLLLDSAIVSKTSNMALKVGEVTKHPANPLFGEDHSWERRFDNLYGNISFDREKGWYKCWYSPFIVAHSAQGMSLSKRLEVPFDAHEDQEMGVCYAQSRDGVNWEKPDLGLVEFAGSRQNNLVMRKVHGAGIFQDDNDENPDRRYKAIFQGLRVSFSSNGLEWSEPQKINCQLAGDTHNNAIWVSQLNKYVAFTRDWIKTDRVLSGAESKLNHGWCRRVARIESTDFVNWSGSEVVIDGESWEAQPYCMTVFPYAGIYLGLLVVHDQVIDRAWTELAYSEDTRVWRRIDPGNALIGCSETELDYDYGCVYACSGPVFLDDEVRLYYGGSDWLHFGWRNGCLALATLRPDGFAGYCQINTREAGRLITKLLAYRGEEIRVTADVAPEGSIIVRILDCDGEAITAQNISSSITDAVVMPASLDAANEIQIEFTVVAAKLFSFVLVSK